MSEELKPCPFCGGRAGIKITQHVPRGYDYTPQCKNPHCCGRLYKKFEDRETAIKMWNRRAT